MVHIKAKTAIIAIILNLSFTMLKFICYFFTGSIAILAEAWHSFSDILTSVLVYFAVKEIQTENSIIKEKLTSLGGEFSGGNRNYILHILKKVSILFKCHLEYKASLLIGILLFFISMVIFKKVIIYTPFQIKNALTTGTIFIFFSFCSYMVSKFEINVGKKENSIALISDGMHTKADMISSLLVGFSLIIYNMGLNIDRLAAFCIGLFIFSFSIEVIVNTFTARLKKKECVLSYRSFEIVSSIFKKETLTEFITFIDEKFKLGLRKSRFFKFIFKHIRLSVILCALFLYSLTCIYTIGTSQEGIIERFGKPLRSKGAIMAGLHFKFPWPIDKVIKVDSKVIQKINIGNVTDENTFALLWTRGHGTEEPFLSGDAERFLNILGAYKAAKDVTQKRLYLESIKEILSKIDQVYLFSKENNKVPAKIKLFLKQKDMN